MRRLPIGRRRIFVSTKMSPADDDGRKYPPHHPAAVVLAAPISQPQAERPSPLPARVHRYESQKPCRAELPEGRIPIEACYSRQKERPVPRNKNKWGNKFSWVKGYAQMQTNRIYTSKSAPKLRLKLLRLNPLALSLERRRKNLCPPATPAPLVDDRDADT